MDKQNVCYALSVGALTVLLDSEPASHTRRARAFYGVLDIIASVAYKIPPVNPLEVEEYEKLFTCLETFLPKLVEEGATYSDLLLNMALFCIEELPSHSLFNERWLRVASCYPATDQYEAIRMGDRAFTRLCTEMEIMSCEGSI